MRFNRLIFILAIILLPICSYAEFFNGFELIKYDNNSITIQYTSNYQKNKLFRDSFSNQYVLPVFDNVLVDVEHSDYFPTFYSKSNFIVPNLDSYKATIVKIVKKEINNIKLAHKTDFEFESEINNEEIYQNFKFKQNPDFTLDYAGISRNQHIANLMIYPIDYDKLSETITYIDTIIIKIDFDVSKATLSPNPNFFSSLSAINFEMSKYWAASQNTKLTDKNEFQSPDSLNISSLSNGKWARIIIEEDGVYRLDAADLQSIGIPANAANTIKIFGKGGKPLDETVSIGKLNSMDEQEIIVRTRQDGNIESVIFFGASSRGFEQRDQSIRHYKNFYSDKNYYLITWGGIDGKRAVAIPNPDGEILNKPTIYKERVFVDEDIVNPHTPGAGRDWLGRSFFSSPLTPVMLHDLDRSGEVEYRFALAHISESQGKFTIFENNEAIGSINLNGFGLKSYISARRGFLNVNIPASQISSDNRSIIKFNYQNPQLTSVGFFDYYELVYPRRFFAVNNKIGFLSDSSWKGLTEFNINGFNGEIFGYDISELSQPKLITNKATTGGMYSFVSDIPAKFVRRFFVSSTLIKPKLEIIEIANLRDNEDNSEIVVITHPDLLASAEKFKEYRQAQSGKKISIFRTDHIYNEFSSSIQDPTAIRDFLINIYNRWQNKPQYLVIWGDGHYDFRNIATNKTNYIPAYQTFNYDVAELHSINEGYSTDDYYALLEGDDLVVDINFGRVTIDNPDLGFWIVDKIKHYESGQSNDIWRSNIILVADDGPADGDSYETEHMGQTENLQLNTISKVNPNLQYDKIYMIEYPTIFSGSGRRKPAVTDEMLTRINTTGGLILNWIGHGNPRVWAHEHILDRDITIPQMRNIDKLFFLTAATCDFGRFDDPEIRSGAEDMFLSRNGGAIGVFSASRIVYSHENAQLTYAFYNRLLSRNKNTGLFPSLGETIHAIKQTFNSRNDRKYFLIGDPTMKLLLPDHKVILTTINDIDLSNNIELDLPALSKVNIKGFVSKPNSTEPDPSFNGTVVVTLRDGDLLIRMQETYLNALRPVVSFRKLGGSLNRSSYKVVNGYFEAEFIIPKDISFSDSSGKLFLYSASDDGRYANGSYHKIRINGFSDIDNRDTTPPEIQIYLDGRKFKSGDLVTSNPRLLVDLFDESGINTTGLGVGHSIEAWIDNSPLSIDLTSKFTSSLVDSRRGTVEDILFGLSPGLHKIRIRAWDVFNNFSIADVEFVIPENSGGLVENVYSYPNPFTNGTNIVFRHNAEAPFDAKIEIYTINGILIRNINNSLNTLHTSQIYWDGMDNNGNVVSDGVYLINVGLKHDSGASLGRGKLIKLGN